MICPKDGCGSPNVRSLPHYWESLPVESPQRGRYAPPAVEDWRLRLLGALAAVVGIALLAAGSIAAGLVLLAGGIAAAVVGYQRARDADAARAAWVGRRICLACISTWDK
jgi:hypothetical protein